MVKLFNKQVECLITNLPLLSKHEILFLGTLNLHLAQTHLPVSDQQFLDDIENFILLHIVDWSLTGDGLERKAHLLHNHLSGISLKHTSIIVMEVARYMSYRFHFNIFDLTIRM